jgi:hypothetical protein
MFNRKPLKKFSVSTSLVYFIGKRSLLQKMGLGRAYTKKAGYKSGGYLLAI